MSLLNPIRKISLRVRIFVSMILLTVLSSILIIFISVIQYRNEAKQYHEERINRKDISIKEHINFVLSNTTYPLSTDNIPLIFKDKIHELSEIHGVEINLYDLDGNLLKSSKASFAIDSISPPIPLNTIKLIQNSVEKKLVENHEKDRIKYRAFYSEIKDEKFKPLAILNLPYMEDDGYYEKGLHEFLIRLGQVYIFILILSVIVAYMLSSYITYSIKLISDKINETKLHHKNQTLEIEAGSSEIQQLIDAYNSMVNQLEDSASKLAQSEREQAWREMAKQVAHEIKNPLTPMRLTVQNFERKFDPEDPEIKQKLEDYTATLLQQIDTMTAVASAFSNFASMPAQQNETLNIVAIVKLALEIFNEDYIQFFSEKETVISRIDRTQLIRIITNLVKNATQAIPDHQQEKRIVVRIVSDDKEVQISVADNGAGINQALKSRIFEPKFTTKTSGMGLGLSIIKNIIESYKGELTFESKEGVGTVFKVKLPIVND